MEGGRHHRKGLQSVQDVEFPGLGDERRERHGPPALCICPQRILSPAISRRQCLWSIPENCKTGESIQGKGKICTPKLNVPTCVIQQLSRCDNPLMGVLSALPGFQWTVHPHKGIVLPTVEAQAPYPATGASLVLARHGLGSMGAWPGQYSPCSHASATPFARRLHADV